MQKGSALIPILLAGLLIILGGFIFYSRGSDSKNPISPVALKNKISLYTSQQFLFKFEYGSDFFVKEDSEEEFNKRGNGDYRKNFKGYVGYEPGKFLGAVVVLDSTKSYDKTPLTVWVFDNSDNLTIEKWYAQYWFYPFVWGDFTYTGKVKLAPKDEATISGQMAKSGIVDYQPGKPKFIYLSKDKKMYLFRIIGQEGDQILSSFKFLQ